MALLLMDFHGCNYTHIRKQMQWEEELTGVWDLAKCVIQEAIKMENHHSPDKQGCNVLVVNHSFSLKAKGIDLPAWWGSEHTHGPGAVWLKKQKSLCACPALQDTSASKDVSPRFLHDRSPPKSSCRDVKERGRWGRRREDGWQAGTERTHLWFRLVLKWVCFQPQGKQKPGACPQCHDGQIKWSKAPAASGEKPLSG